MLLSLFDGLVFFANVSSVKDNDGFYFVEIEDLQHFEDVIKKGVCFNILVVLIGTSVASFVEPGHYVDGCGLVVEGTDVFGDSDWSEQFEESLDSH